MPSPADRLAAPRLLHPLAWWGWGLLICVAASRTTHPLVLLTLLVAVLVVVAARRELGTRVTLTPFLALAAVALVVRLLMTVLLGGSDGGGPVLLRLPEVPLPDWLAGVRLGGPVPAPAVVSALEHALQLAVVLVALGACTVLADPRRLLQHVPVTLYDIGTTLVVSLTVVPQLAEQARQVRAARRLRGHEVRGPREVGRMVVPVLEGALERSMTLAASMESRGYGRRSLPAGTHRRAVALTLVSLVAVLVGLVSLAGAGPGGTFGAATLVLGIACAAASLAVGHRGRRRPYRAATWRLPETLVLAAAVPAVVALVAAPASVRQPDPGGWPTVAGGLVAACLPAVLPAVLAPRTPRRVALEERVAARRASERVRVAAA